MKHLKIKQLSFLFLLGFSLFGTSTNTKLYAASNGYEITIGGETEKKVEIKYWSSNLGTQYFIGEYVEKDGVQKIVLQDFTANGDDSWWNSTSLFANPKEITPVINPEEIDEQTRDWDSSIGTEYLSGEVIEKDGIQKIVLQDFKANGDDSWWNSTSLFDAVPNSVLVDMSKANEFMAKNKMDFYFVEQGDSLYTATIVESLEKGCTNGSGYHSCSNIVYAREDKYKQIYLSTELNYTLIDGAADKITKYHKSQGSCNYPLNADICIGAAANHGVKRWTESGNYKAYTHTGFKTPIFVSMNKSYLNVEIGKNSVYVRSALYLP